MASRQQEKSEQTRNELKESAYNLFLEKGYDKTTVAEITSKAGYSTGSFYRHWKEKKELFAQIQDEFIEDIKLLHTKSFEEISSVDELIEFLLLIIDQLSDNQIIFKLFIETSQGIDKDILIPEVKVLLEYCINSVAQKFKTFVNYKLDDESCYMKASLIYSFLVGSLIFDSVKFQIPDKDILKTALLSILKTE